MNLYPTSTNPANVIPVIQQNEVEGAGGLSSDDSDEKQIPPNYHPVECVNKSLSEFRITSLDSSEKRQMVNQSLSEACENGEYEKVRNYLNQNANPNHAFHNMTPMIWAAHHGNVRMVKLLLQFNADPNVINANGLSPLHKAIDCGHYEVAELLLDHKADPNIGGTLFSTLTFPNENYRSIFYRLIENGADVNSSQNNSSMPLLYSALGDEQLRSTLLSNQYDVNQVDRGGSTSLHWACMSESVDAIRWLLEQGADVNLRNDSNLAPLDYALATVRYEVVECLLSAGTPVNTGMYGDGSALRKVIHDVIKETVPQPGDRTDKVRETLIHIAKLLMLFGANTDSVPEEDMQRFMKKIGLPRHPLFSLKTLVFRQILAQVHGKPAGEIERMIYPKILKDVIKDHKSEEYWKC